MELRPKKQQLSVAVFVPSLVQKVKTGTLSGVYAILALLTADVFTLMYSSIHIIMYSEDTYHTHLLLYDKILGTGVPVYTYCCIRAVLCTVHACIHAVVLLPPPA